MKYTKTIFWENKENTIKESKKYSSRVEFYKKSHGAYTVAKNNGWLDEMTWLNRKNVYKDLVDVVYKYHFMNENAVYIGRTIYPELRDKQHRIREKDTVYRFAKEHDIEIPKMEIIEKGLTVLQGAVRENYWAKYYKAEGFTLINKQPCGSLGKMCSGKWSKEKCFEEAKKYKLRSEFQKNAAQAYRISMDKGWINDMDWFPINRTHPNGYWRNKENFLKEAKKYGSKKELEKGNLAAYIAGWKYGYFDDVEWAKERKVLPFGYWKIKEHTIEESKKYTTRNEFRKGNQSAYWAAIKYKYIDEMTWLSNRNTVSRGYWKNKELIMKEGRKYHSKAEFSRNNRGAYEAALRYGYIKEMDWFGKPQMQVGYWNKKERVFEEAKKYTTRNEFSKCSNGAYNSARKHKWLDEMPWLKNLNEKGAVREKTRWKTKEDVFNEAKKYTKKTEFRKKAYQAYEYARKNNWLEEMSWFISNNSIFKGKWTKEKCFEEGRKYETKSDFYKYSNSAYQRSLKMGYIKEMTWFSKKRKKRNDFEIIKTTNNTKHPKGYWKNRENMMAEAKKYSTKDEFKKGNLTAFLMSYKYGFIDEMHWLVKQKQHKNGYWTYKHIEEEALKYNTKTEFFKGNQTAYRAALKMGVIDDFFVMNDYIQ